MVGFLGWFGSRISEIDWQQDTNTDGELVEEGVLKQWKTQGTNIVIRVAFHRMLTGPELGRSVYIYINKHLPENGHFVLQMGLTKDLVNYPLGTCSARDLGNGVMLVTPLELDTRNNAIDVLSKMDEFRIALMSPQARGAKAFSIDLPNSKGDFASAVGQAQRRL